MWWGFLGVFFLLHLRIQNFSCFFLYDVMAAFTHELVVHIEMHSGKCIVTSPYSMLNILQKTTLPSSMRRPLIKHQTWRRRSRDRTAVIMTNR